MPLVLELSPRQLLGPRRLLPSNLGPTRNPCRSHLNSNHSPAPAATLPTIKPLPGPTAKPAPLPTYRLVPAPTPVPTQTPNDSNADCAAPTAGESKGSEEDTVDGHASGSAPDTYALKVQVETTSLWTSVEVTGVESITSKYAITQGDGEINVDIEG